MLVKFAMKLVVRTEDPVVRDIIHDIITNAKVLKSFVHWTHNLNAPIYNLKCIKETKSHEDVYEPE